MQSGHMKPHLRFASARAKTARVYEVLSDMAAEAREFSRVQEAEILVDLDRERDVLLFSVNRVLAPPAHWPVLIGEVLFNLRSALDHAVYELACENKGFDLDAKTAAASEFLICADPDEFARRRHWRIGAIAPNKQDLIERVQPFPDRSHRHSKTLLDEAPEHLGLLHELNRIEKHRTPPILTHVVDSMSWLSEWPEPTLHLGPIVPGSLIAEMAWHPGVQPVLGRQPRFMFRMAIEHEDTLIFVPGQLDGMHIMVNRVLDVLDDSPSSSTHRATLLEPRRLRR